MIIDSDVLIWFLRGDQTARRTVLNAAPFYISSVTYMELVQGMKNKRELALLKTVIDAMEIKVIHVDQDISKTACSFVEKYYLSDSMELSDALIAATCIRFDQVLCTANYKHYKCIPELKPLKLTEL